MRHILVCTNMFTCSSSNLDTYLVRKYYTGGGTIEDGRGPRTPQKTPVEKHQHFSMQSGVQKTQGKGSQASGHDTGGNMVRELPPIEAPTLDIRHCMVRSTYSVPTHRTCPKNISRAKDIESP